MSAALCHCPAAHAQLAPPCQHFAALCEHVVALWEHPVALGRHSFFFIKEAASEYAGCREGAARGGGGRTGITLTFLMIWGCCVLLCALVPTIAVDSFCCLVLVLLLFGHKCRQPSVTALQPLHNLLPSVNILLHSVST